MGRYTEQELREIFFEALDFFNEALNSSITRDNMELGRAYLSLLLAKFLLESIF